MLAHAPTSYYFGGIIKIGWRNLDRKWPGPLGAGKGRDTFGVSGGCPGVLAPLGFPTLFFALYCKRGGNIG